MAARSVRADRRGGGQLNEQAPACDLHGHLTDPVLEFLRAQPLLKLKVAGELGGAQADNALQFDVYERLAYYNPAASWCCFIYTDVIGLLSAFLPQAGIDMLFARGVPLVCGGGGRLMGSLKPAGQGYLVSGTWSYGSGIHGSDWTMVMALDDEGGVVMCVLPTDQITQCGNWDVLGLQGTGSGDFTAIDVFVPHALTFRPGTPPLRGGAQALLGVAGLIGHTIPAVALGIGQRALDELVAFARVKQRGYMQRTTIGDRTAFQAFVGRADLRLRAARAMMIENGLRLAEIAAATGDTVQVEAEIRAAGPG